MTTTKLYTDAELNTLRSMPKKVLNPGARWNQKPRSRPAHSQRNYQVVSMNDDKARFMIYLRQNLEDETDFSCGISYLAKGALPLTLARYNGPSHIHGDIDFQPHIHRATERAIAAGKRAESEAEATDRFETLQGALACLLADFAITGLNADYDQPRLF
ncbi:MAG: hypothetical protein OXI13_12635 [Gammaproteobacteria bacterium]|nr:hypothetical protein [Gammaproteobacteria bacterium]MYA65823.1 hypothetical protein [Gammaproteobacteria bacterium]MYH47460.1 hypothetical protein [Gammaproteobacteria bacterium]MYL12356.1 hypothetical protein [Gammaproteobacteria bacterium]